MLGIPDAHDLQRLSRGIVVEGRRTAPAQVELLPGKRDDEHSTLRITIHEGRNRQVRNMCEAIGHPVDRLRRVAIGPIRDDRLKPGQWRELTADEVARLRGAPASGNENARSARCYRFGVCGPSRASRSAKRAPLRMFFNP